MQYRIVTRLAAAAALLAGTAAAALATDYATVLTPAKPGLPLAHPIAVNDIPPPPFSENDGDELTSRIPRQPTSTTSSGN